MTDNFGAVSRPENTMCLLLHALYQRLCPSGADIGNTDQERQPRPVLIDPLTDLLAEGRITECHQGIGNIIRLDRGRDEVKYRVNPRYIDIFL